MAPRTRTRNTKILKENVTVIKKTKVISNDKITKPPRKALADKTNSLSDDNASIDIPVKTTKVASKNKAAKTVADDCRPRRNRRLPTRYVENQTSVTSLTASISPKSSETVNQPLEEKEKQTVIRPKRNCRLQSVREPAIKKPVTPNKQNHNEACSPFKSPSLSLDSSLIANRPKRICKLPSKFEDHFVSPSKFIPVQPCHASTPIIQNNKSKENVTKSLTVKRLTRKNNENVKNNVKNTKRIDQYFTKSQTTSNTTTAKGPKSRESKTSPDTNNNPKGKTTLSRKGASTRSPKKQPSPEANIKVGFAKRLLENSLSFRVFEDRKSQDKDQDVYEFTYDPNEEPPPKKKRKRVAKKRPPKPKTVLLKNNYDKNVQKALESLRSKVKPSQIQNTQTQNILQKPLTLNVPKSTLEKKTAVNIQIIEDIKIRPATENKTLNYTTATALPVNESAKSIHMSNYASINIEDIAADFESIDNNDMNYSPVNSPCRPKSPENQVRNLVHINNSHMAINNNDPLNLKGDTSFFDEQPVASSSMNVSIRHPQASPWRVEFNNLPIRWQADTYVKANMTPAVESSFITSEEISKKKHVYTDMVAEGPLPEIQDPPNLKQTSIISFMREVAEQNFKKKRGRSAVGTKANSLFEDMSNSKEHGHKTPKKARKEKVLATPNASNSSNDKSNEKDANYNENHETTNEDHEPSNENMNQSDKSPTKKSKNKDKDDTYFGFDESESYDQENVSPVKNVQHTRAHGLRFKSRAVLQEINAMRGPTRVVLPITTKPKLPSSEVVEQLYNQLKSAEDAPQFQEKEIGDVTAATNDEPSSSDDDGESVHLFEDIEVVHHLKPHRKSYGKARKVTFQHSNSDSDTQTQVPEDKCSDDDDLGDLTFQMPNVKQKKVTKKKKDKKQLSKKEEKEVEEWAAGFNSMCEDIDEFPLVVE